MWEIILQGRWFMVPLMVCSVLCWGVIIERWLTLRQLNVDTSALRKRVVSLMRHNNPEKAVILCKSIQSPVAKILSIGLKKFQLLTSLDRNVSEVETGTIRAMEDYSVHILAMLEKYLVILVTISNIAPLFGFAGTVTGMINAFDTIAQAAGVNASLVAVGIKEALVTTAAGLLIAIPSFIAYNYFSNRVQKFVLQVEESASELIEAISVQSGK